MGLKFETSDETCKYVRSQTDQVIIPFSTGKDSIASYLQALKYWDNDQIHLVFQRSITQADGYTTLAFQENTLRYYERKFGKHIYRLNHVETMRMLYYKVYQAPGRLAALTSLVHQHVIEVKETDYMNQRVREIPALKDAWIGTGIRVVDSLQRRASVKRNGSAYAGRNLFYPIWDWTIDMVLGAITDAGLKLPMDYPWFGRSRDGWDGRVLTAMREHTPEDFQLLLKWFNLVDIDLFRLDQRPRLLKEAAGL
jgi:3'-phosphoadenosine 5'-phosphosulfate sulfotransferase (PAPS reductase)/FAD synthetase